MAIRRLARGIAHHPIDAARQPERIVIPQRLGKQLIGQILIAHGPQEPLDRERPHRGGAHIGGRRKGAAMHHGMTHLHPRRPAVADDAADLAFQVRQQLRHQRHIFRVEEDASP